MTLEPLRGTTAAWCDVLELHRDWLRPEAVCCEVGWGGDVVCGAKCEVCSVGEVQGAGGTIPQGTHCGRGGV